MVYSLQFGLQPKALPLLGLLNADSQQQMVRQEEFEECREERGERNNIYQGGSFGRNLRSPTEMLIFRLDPLFYRIYIRNLNVEINMLYMYVKNVGKPYSDL